MRNNDVGESLKGGIKHPFRTTKTHSKAPYLRTSQVYSGTHTTSPLIKGQFYKDEPPKEEAGEWADGSAIKRGRRWLCGGGKVCFKLGFTSEVARKGTPVSRIERETVPRREKSTGKKSLLGLVILKK